ncbi:MAG: YceI family protein, partial [Candidatus Falkowbacteria bacterium]|nr:YceI family protein [Candidatus Falkowbacteria bacterium]
MNKIIVVIISFFIISGCTIPKTSEIADDVASSSKKIIGDDTVNIGTNNDENSKIQKSNNPININTEDSIVMWNGKKITGTEENGKIKIKQGSLSLSNEQIVTGGEFTINMDSIKENKNTETLEKHLKSTDFFDTAQYPEAKL